MRILTALATTIVVALLVAPADALAISVDTGPPPVTTETTGFQFTWSLDEMEVYDAYECQINAEPVIPDCTSPYTYSGTLADGNHTFTVTGLNGGVADTDNAGDYAWAVDTTAPTVAISSGPSGTVPTGTATFAFTATDLTAVTFQCTLDGGAAAACSSGQTYNNLANGNHTFSVVATDAAGHTGTATRTWTVTAATAPGDTTPPDTTITSGPGGLNNVAQPSVEFTSSEAGSTFQCSVNGGAFIACSSPNVLGALVDGAITFQVRAVDPAGNVDPSPAALSWTRDTTPPAAPSVSTGPRSGPFQTTTDLRARWARIADAASYDSDSRLTSGGANPANGKWGEIQKDGTDTQVDAVVNPGTTACFRVRGTDALGNDSAFTSRCTSVAFRRTSRAVLRRSGYLRLRLNAGRAAVVKRVALVATKCPGCGSVRVVIAGDGTVPISGRKVTKTISLRASSRQRTRLITVTTFSSSTASLARRYVYVFGTRSALSRIEGIGVSPV
jgi:hypothetical protein